MYTGMQTKIMMNSNFKNFTKKSFLDLAVEKIILIQLIIILLFSLISIIFYHSDNHYHIMDGYLSNSGWK